MNFLRRQSGNAMLIVLIGIVLFAALSYAVTQSGRGTASLDKEKTQLLATEIIDFATQVKLAVDGMSLIDRVPPQNIDFRSEIAYRWLATPSPWVANANCTSSVCRVFASRGGTVKDRVFTDASYSTIALGYSSSHPFPGHPAFSRANVVGVGSSAEDLVLQIIRLKQEVCYAINTKLGLPLITQTNDEDWGSAGSFSSYSSLDSGVTDPLFDELVAFQGKTMGCYSQASFEYTFFAVIKAR